MTFSVLYWNLWQNTQLNGEAGASRLLEALKDIIDDYNPDVLGLTEVLKAKHSSAPFVLDFVKSHGRYAHNAYAPASPLNEDWVIGTALCSRRKLASSRTIAICEDKQAEKRGYPGQAVKAITAKIALSPHHQPNIIVAHPVFLRSYTLKHHYEATTTLEKLIRSKAFAGDTILGGDFNEPAFMPKAFRNRMTDILDFKTGSKLHPTWRHNTRRYTPIRANLDHLYWTKTSDFRLTDFEVLNIKVSDHRPLLATFQY